jgi:hypothetical protein
VAAADEPDELVDEHTGTAHRGHGALEGDLVAPDEHPHVGVLLLDGAQQAVLGAEELDHGHAVDRQVDACGALADGLRGG